VIFANSKLSLANSFPLLIDYFRWFPPPTGPQSAPECLTVTAQNEMMQILRNWTGQLCDDAPRSRPLDTSVLA